MKALLRVAREYGYAVHGAHLPPDVFGYTSLAQRRIYFDLGLTPNERRVTIAHEIGHVHYGHTCDDARADRQAETFAARLLIHPDDYAELERVNPDQHHLADELGVTVDLVRHYEQNCLTRLRGVTYSRGKMGAGQWAHRMELA